MYICWNRFLAMTPIISEARKKDQIRVSLRNAFAPSDP
jgi:hypothetical protein